MQCRKNWPLCLGLTSMLALAGCQQKEDRWAAAQAESARTKKAVSSEAAAGAEFNRFFPQVKSPWDIVFKQEKTGFAQASLQKDGKEMAVLSVSDTRNNPQAVDKFKDAQQDLAGYPLTAVGEKGTAILVNDRFQVQIRSTDPAFGTEEREAWLTNFDLEAIGRID